MVNKNQKSTATDVFHEPIAVVGMNCQFPGVESDIEDVNTFYEMLFTGKTPIKEVPKNRWNINDYYDADRKKADKIISRQGGFLHNTHLFDAPFFKISSAEAKQIDPQHRLFLEVAIRALNHANITFDAIENSNTGVYCGISTHEYSQLNYKDNIQFNAYTPIGVANSAAVGRLCHFLNLKGPSMAVDTACSSSLSALYLAMSALRAQQCDMAIVGGVHLSLTPDSFISLSKANMLSAKGRCSSFDEKADGFVRSEGCGVVVVKRLKDALKDNNKIYAVLKSIVMNQDGDGTGLVAPNIESQIAMHHAVLAQANLTPGDINYIEAHGTGTVLGDSVEFNAIEYVHKGQRPKDEPLIIGALKSNLGHTISSSGIASLIKAICSLNYECIPPNLHYTTPNKAINPESVPALLPVAAVPFIKTNNKKRYAQVSNFSFSGTNVSVIIEEAPVSDFHVSTDAHQLKCFVISAHSDYSLKQMMARHLSYLQETTSSLDDICHTLINCRNHYKFRCALLVSDTNSLIKKIQSEEYEITKVTLNKESTIISNDANRIFEAYLAGINIKLDLNNEQWNKVDLPLYHFDRRSYWHEPRKTSPNHWLDRQPVVNVLDVEPIAIIGMSCRFPKAANIDEFLKLLERGESGMTDIPLERWDNDKYYDANMDALGRLYIKQLGLIENVKNFDADFFNISPREAKLMAPQLRVFMETSYHALENANLSLDLIKNSNTGVFVGSGTNEYPKVLANQGVSLDDLNIYFATGNVLNALAGRVAYAFDFHGPIQAIDTACSSAMTAIHNACLSLQSGDCDMAIAGGVNILLVPDSNITLSKARMLSPESRCKTFSDDADGYARSEGCGMVVLKRLSSAIADTDNIIAVIKGSAINSDGKSGGFTVPNGSAQEEVIRSALAKAKLSPSDIDYIEVHGTGTPLADPIEVNALTKIFSEFHTKEKPLFISSVKTNIGHCESASGAAGIIKAILSLQTKQLFKHLNFRKLNPAIQLTNTVIPLSTMDWDDDEDLRCAGVSSFGFSGANAHVIVQQWPKPKKENRILPEESLLILSAKKKASLELLLVSYQKYLSNTQDEFADICYTAATCRSHFLFRVAIKASSAKQAALMIQHNEYTITQIKKEKDGVVAAPITLEHMHIAHQEGLRVNWPDFYKSLNTPFEKINLPLYEFIREEYWFNDTDTIKNVSLPKDWYFQVQWHHQSCNQSNRTIQNNNWLLIGDKKLAANFINLGLNILLEEEQYPLEQFAGVIFATGLESAFFADIDASIEFQKHTLKKLLNLINNLNQQAIHVPLLVLTTNAIAELAGEKTISNSPMVGFCRTLALELPQFHPILIDLEQYEKDLAFIVDEIRYNHGSHYEHIVAYREGKRLVARLKRITLIDKKYSLHGAGRYLITGGCGGLGLITAQALLSSGARELILLSRNVDKPSVISAIKKIQADYPRRIIRVISLDVTDKEKLADLLFELNRDGLLKGIIHAAGSVIKASLIDHQDDDIDYLFSAKVKGAWYLHELSQTCNLDFFVVYSSIASVFGSNKESVYSATNSFLDGLIAERQRLGLVGTAIQWGPWGEVGMAQKRSRDQGLKQALINNDQGHALIKVLINNQFSHITVISPEYLKFMLDFVPKPSPAFYNALAHDLIPVTIEENKDVSSWLNDYFKIETLKQCNACKEMLSGICKKILELSATDDLDDDEGFFELGFDSLMITELATELKEKLEPSLKINATIGFDYPSINKLAQYIETELNKQAIKLRVPTSNLESENNDIAIIGMSCSLPNAPDILALERLLEEGRSGIKDIPLERWDNSKYYHPNKDMPGKSYVTKMGLIENIKNFDAHFFGISPREAKLMEPQQRLFLECCYKALENANYHSETLRGSLTGVYAGVGPNEYYAQLEKSGFSNEELSNYSITGNVLNLIPGRVAYTFDFKGPSISVDTACSSSLVAIHYACQGLKNGETDYALAGGVNILLMPESNITLCKANALSPEGQCKTFDAQADGYVRAEGCGVILLKRLSDAIRDKDTILAVIKASAVNNDGKSAGLTVPNGKSQEEVMMKALSQTDLSSNDISYIEAHGTGTPLGDPIEVHAINQVYGTQRTTNNPLYLGTVKTNIGHLESASGIAGMIKTIIGLQKSKIYKHLNFKTLNPKIKIENAHIASHTIDWPHNLPLKSAAVNAFGFSGTNAHVILQEFPKNNQPFVARSAKACVLILSAKSRTALTRLIHRYQHYLATTSDDFCNICFTAATCREQYHYRLALIAKDTVEAGQLLKEKHFSATYGENNLIQNDSSEVVPSIINYLMGEKIDWASFYQEYDEDFIKVALPNYTFDRKEFWPEKKRVHARGEEQVHPLLGHMVLMPNNEYLFSNKLDLDNLNYIKHHCVFEKMVFPATAYIESGLAVAKILFKKNAFQIEQFTIQRPLYPVQGQNFQLQVKPKSDKRFKINIFAQHDDDWQLFAEMEVSSPNLTPSQSVTINHLKSLFGTRIDLSQIYEELKAKGLFYGDEFQVLQEGYVRADSVLAQVTLATLPGTEYYYHPVMLDGAMQSLMLLSNTSGEHLTYVPYALSRISTYQATPRTMWVYLTRCDSEHAKELWVDIKLYDTSGLLIGEIEELKFRRVTPQNFTSYESTIKHLYQTQWLPINLETPSLVQHPDFLVISQDKIKVEKIFGQLNYQLIPEISLIKEIENKTIVFLYEQGQFEALFRCCKILFRAVVKRFILVTEHAYAIHEHDTVNPYHTMASSFWKSFSNELGLDENYTIDLNEQTTLEPIINHIIHTKSDEKQFAIRDSVFIPKLKKKRVSTNHQITSFDKNATYLIVGGTGGLAKPLIAYLMRQGVHHIVITSRCAYSEETKALIDSAKQKNVLIRHYEVDGSNYQQMDYLFKTIKSSPHPLKGVFHLAGVIQDGLIVNLTNDDVQRVLNAKMDSALILHQLTCNTPLDMFVLFSSSASLLGARGQSNYVAANGFLDGLAHLRHQQGLPALSINWGPFSLGMAENLAENLQHHGFILLNEQSIEILDLLLNSHLTQIAPCPIHWEVYFKHESKSNWLSDFVKNTPVSDQYFLNSLQQHTQDERITILSQVLCEITADVLALENTEQITPKTGLFSLGLDSLMSIEMRHRIHDKLQCPTLNLSIEYFINDPTIESIARNIAHQLPNTVDDPPCAVFSKDIALYDFQYLFWVLNKLDSSFNIGMQLQLHGNLNQEILFQAFDLVVKQNSAFWLSFNKEAPIQIVNKKGEFKLIYEDISLSNELNILNKEFTKNIMAFIPLDHQPLIRVHLYKINNNVHELHIIIPHIIVDDASCEIILNQFKSNYAELLLGKQPSPIVEKDSYLNFVMRNINLYEKNLTSKINFWKNYNKGYRMLHFGYAHHLPNAASQPQHLFHFPLAPNSVTCFMAWHKEKNLNVSTGLIALCQIAFYKMTDQNKTPIILIHSGREGSQYKSIVGLFSEYKRINVELKEEDKLIDYIQSIEKQLLKTAPYQKISHIIKDDGLQGSRLSISQYLTFTWNKLFLANHFKKSKLSTLIIDYYLHYLSRVSASRKSIMLKYKLNKLFDWTIPLQKPEGLRVLLSITPSFFTKEHPSMNFADLKYNFPNHFSCMDRPTGNRTLWIYFSKNQQGEYLLSINGPLTIECKEQIATNFNAIMAKFVERNESAIAELIDQ